MLRANGEVCVLGAGLTGAIVALELAGAGVDVVLVDRDDRALNRASLRNEGKIHLGFVYANDPDLATPDLMLDGALSFRQITRRVLGTGVDGVGTSTPFTYLVARDSLLSPPELEERYAAIERLYAQKVCARPDRDYLGRKPRTIFRRADVATLSSHFRTEHIIGAFSTEELAIDTIALARATRAALADSPRIRFLPNRRVATVERHSGRFQVVGSSPEGRWQLAAEQVVNATWDDRFRIDRSAGIEPDSGWLHRLKYRVIARIPERMCGGPSATMVLGPFGDVVIRPNGTAYFSWYPAGMQGWTHSLAPPDAWTAPCKGEISECAAASIAGSILAAIDRWYPGAAQATPMAVDAGVIVAYGRSDVDDPASGLHNRTRVGVLSVDGYHTVDPGKLTTAPLFALRAARGVLGLEVSA